jgi:primosomal protein N' (replication factor Y)
VAQAAGLSDYGVAQVVPLLRIHHLGDRRFDYLVPEDLAGRVRVGSVVGVRFGVRSARGVVVGLTGRPSQEAGELRILESVEDMSIPEGLISLAEQLAERYLASLESCLRLVVPPLPPKGGGKQKPAGDSWVCRAILATELPGSALSTDEDPGSLKSDVAAIDSRRLTRKQETLLAVIPDEGMYSKVACERASVGKTVLNALAQKGLVRIGTPPEACVVDMGSWESTESEALWPTLYSEQQAAVERLVDDYESAGLACRQLWGVTGSGKTEVYLHLAAWVLKRGAGAILLVPEIALTPLMIERVRQRFGDKVGVIHSGLTPAQRRLEYARIADGEARVVVGARSAVFAPVRDLRLVIIDESHDTSYKQEEAPGYHVKVAGELRLAKCGGLLLEGSASPAVESMTKVDDCVRLSERPRGAQAECEVVDMRHQAGGGVLAAVTREALAQTLRRGEQAIVLLNRRGYSGYVHCGACGHVMMCEDCELSLTYHSQARRLLCHHCGRSYVQPPVCPKCEEAPLVSGGPGTQRLVDELGKLVPAKQIFRLDSDVLTSGARVRNILEDFSASRPAVLVGTQMVAKGHDFPYVTLVVVANADTALYVPDFRSSERTFQLLTQASGRSGRAETAGRVLVQTWNPDVPCIRMALERQDEAFYARELAIRERLGYPPFTQLIRLITVGEQARHVQLAAQHLAERLGPHFGASDVRGPVRLLGLRGKSRWHLVVSSEDGERARAIVAQAVAQLGEPYRRRGVSLMVDVDPLSFV